MVLLLVEGPSNRFCLVVLEGIDVVKTLLRKVEVQDGLWTEG